MGSGGVSGDRLTPSRPRAPPRARVRRPSQRRELLAGALFLAPSLLLFGVFVYSPLLTSAYLSTTSWDLVAPVKPFVGLQNYQRLATDPRFALVIKNTVVYAGTVVGASIVIGLALALLLNRRLVARGAYRAVVFSPYVTSTAVVALVWGWMFDSQYGPINRALRWLLLPSPDWLASTSGAMAAIVIIGVWHNVGYTTVILLAGLQSVPRELQEAARIDGASALRVFLHVTLPFLTPTTYFLMVTGLIVAFQMFDTVAVMTQGGPLDGTNLLAFFLYQHAFRFFDFGYASAIAMVAFTIVLVLTIVQMLMARYWVTYG